MKHSIMVSMGLDISTSATGLVVLQANPDHAHPHLTLEMEISSKQPSGAARNRDLAMQIMQRIHDHEPDKITIEGYSLNMKNAGSVIPLVELGGIVRLMMHLDEISWYDPTASEVKKFCTGKGNAPKNVVMMNVLKRWGHESKTDNTADAYVCAALGLATSNQLPGITQEMRAVAGKLALKCN